MIVFQRWISFFYGQGAIFQVKHALRIQVGCKEGNIRIESYVGDRNSNPQSNPMLGMGLDS